MDEIPAVHIVDKTIVIVVDVVVRRFGGVDEDVVFEIAMIDVDAGVDDAYDDVLVAGSCVPGGFGADAAADRRRILQRPLRSVETIVRHRVEMADVVWLVIKNV